MNAVNYQKELDKIIGVIEEEGGRPTLLLHSCCAPCSSYCLVYLRKWFDITCFYYNPNITNEDEYYKRVNELKRLASVLNEDPIGIKRDDNGQIQLTSYSDNYLDNVSEIKVISGDYDANSFIQMVQGRNYENEPEGGKRCVSCYDMRLDKTALVAAEGDYSYFSTTLTISPLKNAVWLNGIGVAKSELYNSKSIWLPSDFKKKNGYKFSVELSERYNLYRQNYCGCDYSIRN